jgi:hypothetical protein
MTGKAGDCEPKSGNKHAENKRFTRLAEVVVPQVTQHSQAAEGKPQCCKNPEHGNDSGRLSAELNSSHLFDAGCWWLSELYQG